MPSGTLNIDYLLSEVMKLKSLLEDPHPRLASWRHMYSLCMENIADFWNGKQQKESTNAQ